MAFSTEFVMGAGGAEVEEIPVSMSGRGPVTTYPLTTVNAGAGAWVWVKGTATAGGTTNTNTPLLVVGGSEYPLRVDGLYAGGGFFTGTVSLSVLTRNATADSTFTGTVYVIRM